MNTHAKGLWQRAGEAFVVTSPWDWLAFAIALEASWRWCARLDAEHWAAWGSD